MSFENPKRYRRGDLMPHGQHASSNAAELDKDTGDVIMFGSEKDTGVLHFGPGERTITNKRAGPKGADYESVTHKLIAGSEFDETDIIEKKLD
ncbi:hypothetical protein RCL1_000299 [Eukaryota sp. TZLM3-RCL]